MNAWYEATRERLTKALQHADETKAIVIGEQTLSQTVDLFRVYSDKHKAVIIADQNTYQAAGKQLETLFHAMIPGTLEPTFVFEDSAFHSDQIHVDQLKRRFAETDAIPIAIGSGTINDLTKYASHLTERRYICVATAASMDGYTSFGASIEINESKQTVYCPAPLAVVIDMNIIAAAPREMGGWGYADLTAKIPAGADWMLADLIGTEPIHPIAWELVQTDLRDWLANPEGIANGDQKTLTHLIEGLLMSGLAMQKAKSSRPASGAEHQFSHLWDNQNHTYQGYAPSHGAKVGIGTISTSALYENVLTLTRNDFVQAKQHVLQQPDKHAKRNWPEIEAQARHHFGETELARLVLEQSRSKYVEFPETVRRLELFAEHWETLKPSLRSQLMPAVQVQQMIRASGAPSTPEEIGIERPRLKRSFEQAQLIRSRYNVLDFVLDIGCWERLIAPLFATGGIWEM